MPNGNKTPGTLVAEIKMSRTSPNGSFLIVEGKDDVRFWTSRRHTSCELVDGEGKRNVVGGIQRLDAMDFTGVLGIVDSDYDPLNGMGVESENLLVTDAHDLECLLCRSSALDKVLAEHRSRAKIEKFENETGTDVRTGLLERTLVFGRLRWASERRPVIALRKLNIEDFIDKNTWSVSNEELICNTLLDSRKDALALIRRINDLPEADPWYIVRGHDMVKILWIGLHHVLGEMPASTGMKEIGRILQIAMSREDLQETRLWTDIRGWEAANRPYTVLRVE